MISTCDCQVFSDVAAAYVDKKLGKDEMAAVNEHLVECAACRDTLRCFREVHGVLSLSQLQDGNAESCRQDACTISMKHLLSIEKLAKADIEKILAASAPMTPAHTASASDKAVATSDIHSELNIGRQRSPLVAKIA